MPFYEVHHSYPLSRSQKSQIAQAITSTHSTAFLTPSLFVHVRFNASDATDQNYFLAGKPATSCTNRIIGMVRTGSSRAKKDFDDLMARIEDAWYEAVSGPIVEEGKDQGKREGDLGKSASEVKARKLIVIALYGMVGAREGGHVIPAAGDEAAWFKELKPEFQRLADQGEEEYKDLLDEVENREDLKKAYLG